MLRAGRGVAGLICDLLAECGGTSVLLIAGKGNNGGDVFAAATELADTGLAVEVWLCGSSTQLRGDAQIHFQYMVEAGVIPKEVHSVQDFTPTTRPDLIVDGLLGTGSSGAPRGCMADLIDWVNQQRTYARILSIDLPSGVDSDHGTIEGTAVYADLTATLGLPKTGLIRPVAISRVGRLEVVDIGLPKEILDEMPGCLEAEYIHSSDVKLPRRERDGHKGKYGHVVLIGGSVGYTGAIAMAARAALRSGAGLVSVLTPQEVYPVVTQACGLEAMVHPFSSLDALAGRFFSDWKKADAVLVGPGLGRSDAARGLVESLLPNCSVPLVLDADALCVTAEQLASAAGPVVFTPHPGEFERLFGAPVTDRWRQAREAAERAGQIVVLKGAGTVIARCGDALWVNLTGNPGMAKGGSGDVLAGMLVSFLGQGIHPLDAAKTAVYLHGLAGDIAAERLSQEAMLPTDLIESLPQAFGVLSSY